MESWVGPGNEASEKLYMQFVRNWTVLKAIATIKGRMLCSLRTRLSFTCEGLVPRSLVPRSLVLRLNIMSAMVQLMHVTYYAKVDLRQSKQGGTQFLLLW